MFFPVKPHSYVSNTEAFSEFIAHECADSTARCDDADHVPLVWKRGRGSLIEDVEGVEYIDLCASFGSLPLGHHHPAVVAHAMAYMQDQGMMQGLGDVYGSVSKARFIRALCGLLPTMYSRVALTLSGSDAVEYALKTSMLYTQKPGVIALRESYHGLQLGAMALTGMQAFCQPFPGRWQSHPHVYHLSYGSTVKEVVALIDAHSDGPDAIGQMIVEPVLGRFGVHALARDWLQDLYEALHDRGCVLIFDEVYTGVGRVDGVCMASAQRPADVVCLGKAVGGGMPLSCVVATEAMMAAWPQNTGEALHTGTFYGHPLSCEVATKTLQVLVEENIMVRARELSHQVQEWLLEHVRPCAVVKEVRCVGMMIACECYHPQQAWQAVRALRAQRVVALLSGVRGENITLTPALNIPSDLLWRALSILKSVLRRL